MGLQIRSDGNVDCWILARGLMLRGAAIFLLVGLVAALLGFTTIAGASFAIAKVLAGIFLLIFLLFLVLALFATRAA
jgi:uncharacterized membrane protein YtjA (UPF0391 family)